MKSSIYEYRDYKKFLTDAIESSEGGPRGKRKELAESIGCQVSHISNVLSGTGHFSAEQTEAAGRFFGLSNNETEFLLLLVQYNRSGTPSLTEFYAKLLKEKQSLHSSLKERLNMSDELQGQQEAQYYSSWHYGAIHVILSVPEFQTREIIAQRLNLPQARVDEVLTFLIESGLAEKAGSKYQITRKSIHLDKSSHLISKHHTNWRLKSILALDDRSEKNLHYSSVLTLSHKDRAQVEEILTQALSEALKVVTASEEEHAAVLCLDFFSL